MKELFKDNPLATEYCKQWFGRLLCKNANMTIDAPEEFVKNVFSQSVEESSLVIWADTNPRCYFDMLDENNLFISITKLGDDVGGKFQWSLNNAISGINDVRIDCEKEALGEAIKLLEHNLKENGTSIQTV